MSSANLLFLSLLFLGPFVSVSSTNWIVCWAGLELSFLGLIPLLFLSNKYMSLSKEAAMKYFCIQAMGSALLFYGGLTSFSSSFSDFSVLVLILSIFIKLGIFPSHFWVPGVVSGLDWAPMLMLLTIQKVAPFAFLSLVFPLIESDFLILLFLLGGVTSLVGGLLGNNQTDLRAMLGSSSIAHSGWLLLGILTGHFWVYFSIYCVSLSIVFYFLVCSNLHSETGVGLLSLSGLPPFMMFIGKWAVLKSAIEISGLSWILSLFLLGAVVSLVFYLKFSYSFILTSGSFLSLSKPVIFYFLIINFTSFLLFFTI